MNTAIGTGVAGNAGVGGPGVNAQLSDPFGIAADSGGNLYVADVQNNRVLRVDAATNVVTLVAGNGLAASSGDGGPATEASLNGPSYLAFDSSGNLFISETNGGYIRRVDAQTGFISTVAGNGSNSSSGDGGPATSAGLYTPGAIAVDASGNLFITQYATSVRVVAASTGIISTISTPAIQQPVWVGVDGAGNLYISDVDRVERVVPGSGTATIVFGNGRTGFSGDAVTGTSTGTGTNPMSIAVDAAGNLFVGDPGLGRIRRMDATTGLVFTVAGNGNSQLTGDPDGETATQATLGWPAGLAVTASGTLYFAVPRDNKVRQVNLLPLGDYTAAYLSFNPSTVNTGQNVTLTASLTAAGQGPMFTGSMGFNCGSQTNWLSVSGTTTSVTLPVPSSPGNYSCYVVYSGDSNYSSSYSPTATLAVQNGTVATTTTLTSSQNPANIQYTVNITATITPNGQTSQVPTGTVRLYDTGTYITTVSLANGVAQFSGLQFHYMGPHQLTAVYSGDANFVGSTSAVLTQMMESGSSVYLNSSAPFPTVGTPITFTATMGTGQSNATGTIQFTDSPTYGGTGTILATVPLSNGTASFTTSTLAIGTHYMTANYSGDSTYMPSNGMWTQSVQAIPVTVSLTGPGTYAPTNTPVTFSVALSASSTYNGPPTGTVQLLNHLTVIGVAQVQNNAATFQVTFQNPGTEVLAAVYSGDSTYQSVTSQNLITYARVPSSMQAIIAPNPATAGQNVSIQVWVQQSGATGTIELDDVTSGSPVSLGVQITPATFNISTLSAGTHSLSAKYSGDSTFMPVTASVGSLVILATTTTAISASPSTANPGQAVTLTASVTPPAATGTVQFFANNFPIGTATVSAGAATLTTTTLAAGSNNINCLYSGDANYASSSSGYTSVFVKTASTVMLQSSSQSASVGQRLTLTAVVAPASATGTVQFLDGGTAIGSASVGSGGVATISASLAVGTHILTATYSGDGVTTPGSSAVYTQTITKAPATAVVSSSLNPSVAGQSVTFSVQVSPSAATGTVQVLDGGAAIGTITLSGGAGSMSTSSLAAGSHSITAVYSGDGTYLGATSSAITETVKATTTTAVTSNNASASTGQMVQLTATVTPSSATGTIQFFDGSTALGTIAISGGSAVLASSTLAIGTHSITAAYSGDGNNAASTSAVYTQTVTKISSSVAVTSSSNPSVVGQSVTFNVQVSPGAATGTVQVMDGATAIGTITLSGGAGSMSISSLAAGSHSIAAVYSGDATYSGSTSGAVGQTVNKAASTTTAASSSNPSIFGQSVTFTASVSPAAATGTVQFLDGGVVIGTAAVNSGMAALTTSSLAAGTHSITAVYSGDGTYSGSTSAAVQQTVNKAASTTTAASSSNPSTFGQALTFTASVSPAAATGTVQFLDGGSVIGTAVLNSGMAALTISGLAAGTHSVAAVYSGDASYSGSTSAAVGQTVNKAATAIAAASSVNPANYGQAITFSAAITPATATGTVQFLDGGTILGTVGVVSGSAALTSSSLAAGSHSISAVYSGDANYAGASVGLGQTVKPATTTSLTSNTTSITYDQTVTFTATISPSAATGTVVFLDGGVSLGSPTVSNGQARLSVATLAAGSHSVTAVYSGDATYSPSSSSARNINVAQAKPSISLSATPSPVKAGDAVTFTATVSPNTATGTVAFYDGSTLLGTGTLSGGTATYMTSALASGIHAITAVYSGDTNFVSVTSNKTNLKVN